MSFLDFRAGRAAAPAAICLVLNWMGGLFGSTCAQAEVPTAIDSPEALWRDVDPEALPLETQSIRRWDEEGGEYESLRFTGEVVDGARVRVYALTGAPAGADRAPGVLHVHGGGQTASLDWVRFWVRRGYVCVSFDFCGDWQGRTEFTDWGPVKHANMAQAAGGFQLTPTPRESSWFHWALVARRALTLLARQPRVDPERLGVFGISVGGSLAWMIAGFDRRVQAAVPIYGCGYNYDRRNIIWGDPPPSDDLRRFQRVLGPEAHAPHVECPVLFLNATNDFHGLFDRCFETLDALTGVARQAFTPRYNHHIHPQQGGDLPRWMDWHLKDAAPFPRTPRLILELDEGGTPVAQVLPADRDEVETVEVYYSLGEKRPPARFWRGAPCEPVAEDSDWTARLPVLDIWADLRVFANVTYRSGVCLSTRMRTAVPGQMGRARATLERMNQLESGERGLDHWYFTNGYTDPHVDKTYLTTGDDPQVGPFVSANLPTFGDPVELRLSTHIVGDAQYSAPPGAALSLTCRGAWTDAGLTVIAVRDDWAPSARRFSTRLPPTALGSDWREIVLAPARFVDADGKPLEGWSSIDKLELELRAARNNPPCVAGLRWELPPAN